MFAIIDDELKGKVIEEGDKVLDCSADFYKGDLYSEEETKKIMQAADNLNLVGKKTIELAKTLNLVAEDNIRSIGGVLYAQTSRMDDSP